METEQDILRRRLEQAEQALEHCEREAIAGRFAGAIMHEVNNPLEAIANLVYLTKLQKNDPIQVVQNMDVIGDQLTSLGRVTSQALGFHRQHAEAKEVDLVDIASSALKLHMDRLTRHGVIVDRRFRGPALAKIHGSEILQVISNLIMNAVDALPRADGHLCIGVKTSNGSAHISIHDDGPGIPKELEKRLFEPYVTSKSSGTGLGLWLSKRIVSKHLGTLRFRTSRNKPGGGTTFRISLPLAITSSQDAI